MECVTGHLDWKNGHFLPPMENLSGTKRARPRGRFLPEHDEYLSSSQRPCDRMFLRRVRAMPPVSRRASRVPLIGIALVLSQPWALPQLRAQTAPDTSAHVVGAMS